MELKNSIILVVGAAGMIGSEFTKSLLDQVRFAYWLIMIKIKLIN